MSGYDHSFEVAVTVNERGITENAGRLHDKVCADCYRKLRFYPASKKIHSYPFDWRLRSQSSGVKTQWFVFRSKFRQNERGNHEKMKFRLEWGKFVLQYDS